MIKPLIRALYEPSMEMTFDDHLADHIIEHSLTPQVYHLLHDQHKWSQVPVVIQKKLNMNYKPVFLFNMFLKSQNELLLGQFENMCVEVMPIKGVYFAEKYFGHLGARGTTDIDILIRKKDIDKAIAVVKSMGFEIEEEEVPGHFHISYSKIAPDTSIKVKVEIHWDILKESTSNFNVAEFWDGALKVGNYQYVKMLSDYHTFYLMCLHGWRHNLDSPKHYLDIIQMIYVVGHRFNYEDLLRNAKTHQTYKRMLRTLSIVYNEYPMLERVKAFPRKKISRKGHQYIDFIDYQFLSYDHPWHSLHEVGQWLVPNQFEIESQLKSNEKRRMYILQLVNLYKQRITSACKAIFLRWSQ
ncbi:nucleotidyltransferase family protein [Paenibacillus sp. LjRoot153]|uniref:nucleotidyltransferase family protein n=1 Tax=Paenibacillus sp. LjRoot153 TaxID=3342270 RepID=UPI003ECFAD09